MSTSDPSEPLAATPGTPRDDIALTLAKEIERLANLYFAGVPGPAMNGPAGVAPSPPVGAPVPMAPPNPGPSALAMGAGGASPAVSAPPVPGFVHRPSLASSPLPDEASLRALPAMLADSLGTTPTALAQAPSGSTAGAPDPSSSLYFLSLAGGPPREPELPPFAAQRPGSAYLPGVPSVGANGPATVTPPSPMDAPTAIGTPNQALDPLALGAGGASPGASELPLAGFGHRIPLASGSIPDDASVWTLPTTLDDSLGATSVPFADAPTVPATGTPDPSSSLYFLSLAGATPREPERATVRAQPLDEGAHEFRPTIVPHLDAGSRPFDAHVIKRDFPILQERIHGRPLVWLDNAATTQKPQAVIDRVSQYYERENSNVHRAAHVLAARATDAYEGARDRVRGLLNAPSSRNIVFVRGATEAINLVAKSWGERNVGAGDEIVITWLEHHANIVPWQQLCSLKGARLRVAPVDDRGQVKLEDYERLLGPKTRIVSMPHVSNALGTIVPVHEMIEMAHRHGAVVHVDGAQAVSHMPVDVQALDCDFYTFSGHKIFAPMGIGALFGKAALLETMPPWQGGGNMIQDVTFEKTSYQPPPLRFEAGTGSIGDAVGLGAAIDYVSAIGLDNIARYEHELRVYAEEKLVRVPGLRLIGTAAEKAGVMSFVLDGVRTEDVGAALDQEGIAVRSGHHCAQPILRRFGLESTVRASLAPYNTREDIDALEAALLRLQAGRPIQKPD
jgi:cysteine desulfurase/selenocysteine lyase